MKKYNYIYIITNKTNGKIYIGKHSTDNLDDEYMGSGVLLSKAKQKYGLENFTKDYLAFCDSEDTLNYLERFYIKKYKAKEVGYNLTDGGDGMVGLVFTNEHRRKIGEKTSLINKGKAKSSEHKQKISETLKGKMTGENNPNFGKHHIFGKMTQEHKQKISESNKHPHKKARWQTSSGEIRIMDISNARKHHPDWIKIGEV